VLLAVTLGHTPIGAVEESAERLRAANAALLGLSLDGITERRESTYEATYAYAGADASGEQGAVEEISGGHAAPAEDGAEAATPAAATGTDQGDADTTTTEPDAGEAERPAGDTDATASAEAGTDGDAPAEGATTEAADPAADEDDADATPAKDRTPVGAETP
jgi:hypothetical protein